MVEARGLNSPSGPRALGFKSFAISCQTEKDTRLRKKRLCQEGFLWGSREGTSAVERPVTVKSPSTLGVRETGFPLQGGVDKAEDPGVRQRVEE